MPRIFIHAPLGQISLLGVCLSVLVYEKSEVSVTVCVIVLVV